MQTERNEFKFCNSQKTNIPICNLDKTLVFEN